MPCFVLPCFALLISQSDVFAKKVNCWVINVDGALLFFLPSSQLSLPESNESHWDEEEDEDLLEVESYEESMQKLAEFLKHIGLEKYLSVFEEHEIEFNGMLELNEADLRKLFE